MVNDLKEIILLQKPDIIFGSDYDYHEEHHLVTIAIDEALGKVLKSKSKYRPMVMKSYAYRTTWESYPDYYKNNIRSTLYKKATVETYPWEERLRLPIAAHLLNRSLLRSDIFRQYKTFKSQELQCELSISMPIKWHGNAVQTLYYYRLPFRFHPAREAN